MGKTVRVKSYRRDDGTRVKSHIRTMSRKPSRDVARDKRLKAKHAGKRVSKSGNVYYEYRKNRSDKDRRRKL